MVSKQRSLQYDWNAHLVFGTRLPADLDSSSGLHSAPVRVSQGSGHDSRQSYARGAEPRVGIELSVRQSLYRVSGKTYLQPIT